MLPDRNRTWGAWLQLSVWKGNKSLWMLLLCGCIRYLLHSNSITSIFSLVACNKFLSLANIYCSCSSSHVISVSSYICVPVLAEVSMSIYALFPIQCLDILIFCLFEKGKIPFRPVFFILGNLRCLDFSSQNSPNSILKVAKFEKYWLRSYIVGRIYSTLYIKTARGDDYFNSASNYLHLCTATGSSVHKSKYKFLV